jgi:hypothetical protein
MWNTCFGVIMKYENLTTSVNRIWILFTYKIFFVLVMLVTFISTIWLLHINKSELIPQLWISAIALGLSYWACMFSRENFRLLLLDKRFEIYQKTLEFCSRVIQQGTLNEREDNRQGVQAAIVAAHDSFRGIGYHKTRALFGNEIWELFEKLNKSYTILLALGGVSSSIPGYENVPQKMCDELTFISETCGRLPEYFRPYVYFGDYKQ